MTKTYSISEVSKLLGLTNDTLRYYEKINLIRNVSRKPSGVRIYSEKNVSDLRFIQRAQYMNFSLAEIGQLIDFRTNPQIAKDEIRQLASQKLSIIDDRLSALNKLQTELQLLIDLCHASEEGCPIIDDIEKHS